MIIVLKFEMQKKSNFINYYLCEIFLDRGADGGGGGGGGGGLGGRRGINASQRGTLID